MHAGIGLGVSTNGFQSFSSLDISGRWDRLYFELKHISKAFESHVKDGNDWRKSLDTKLDKVVELRADVRWLTWAIRVIYVGSLGITFYLLRG